MQTKSLLEHCEYIFNIGGHFLINFNGIKYMVSRGSATDDPIHLEIRKYNDFTSKKPNFLLSKEFPNVFKFSNTVNCSQFIEDNGGTIILRKKLVEDYNTRFII